jgi:tetratricopeptide (TPR) repeat protein
VTARSTENSFMKGLAALRAGDHLEAMVYFEAAVLRDRQINPHRPTMKYVSFYAVSLSLATDRHEDALRLCRSAAESEFYNPDIFCNLGRVALRAGQRGEAWVAFRRGLTLNDAHPALRFEMRRMGARRAPVFRFLPRRHIVNRLAGRLRLQLESSAPVTST